MSGPYRQDPVRPVCATCKHRADAKTMDHRDPWRDWLCLATSKVLWAEEYNPITSTTRAAKMGYERCVKVNGDGECSSYERETTDRPAEWIAVAKSLGWPVFTEAPVPARKIGDRCVRLVGNHVEVWERIAPGTAVAVAYYQIDGDPESMRNTPRFRG